MFRIGWLGISVLLKVYGVENCGVKCQRLNTDLEKYFHMI
jgi:hypothetical protein